MTLSSLRVLTAQAAELNPIGNTANSLFNGSLDTGRVAADSRKTLVQARANQSRDNLSLAFHSTPAPPSQDSLFTGEDETFAFRRAISRLHEMQSEQYLAARTRYNEM